MLPTVTSPTMGADLSDTASSLTEDDPGPRDDATLSEVSLNDMQDVHSALAPEADRLFDDDCHVTQALPFAATNSDSGSEYEGESDADPFDLRPSVRPLRKSGHERAASTSSRRSLRSQSSSSWNTASRSSSVGLDVYTSRSPSPDVEAARGEESAGARMFGGLKALTWKEIRSLKMKNPPESFFTRDMPHRLQDIMNVMPEYVLQDENTQLVFLQSTITNTSDDEPNAPPLEIENEYDAAAAPPFEFEYSNRLWHADDVTPPTWEGLTYCDCVGPCNPNSKTCACVKRHNQSLLDVHEQHKGFAYNEDGTLKERDMAIFECNDLCGCSEDCMNRVGSSLLIVTISSIDRSDSIGLATWKESQGKTCQDG
jgi:hypothetical protein